MRSNLSINNLIAITGLGFTAIAVFADVVSVKIDLVSAMTSGIPLWIQLMVSCVLTPPAAIAIHYATRNVSGFHELSDLNRSIVQEINPTLLQIIGLSAAAGMGEEVLFRGALQPFIGMIPTSLIFAGLHTGFRFNTRVFRLYLGMLFFISLILSLIADRIGLPAAMTVHGVWDLTMLILVRKDIGVLSQ